MYIPLFNGLINKSIGITSDKILQEWSLTGKIIEHHDLDFICLCGKQGIRWSHQIFNYLNDRYEWIGNKCAKRFGFTNEDLAIECQYCLKKINVTSYAKHCESKIHLNSIYRSEHPCTKCNSKNPKIFSNHDDVICKLCPAEFILIHVLYQEKNIVKKLGAKWCQFKKTWYFEKQNPMIFSKWFEPCKFKSKENIIKNVPVSFKCI